MADPWQPTDSRRRNARLRRPRIVQSRPCPCRPLATSKGIIPFTANTGRNRRQIKYSRISMRERWPGCLTSRPSMSSRIAQRQFSPLMRSGSPYETRVVSVLKRGSACRLWPGYSRRGCHLRLRPGPPRGSRSVSQRGNGKSAKRTCQSLCLRGQRSTSLDRLPSIQSPARSCPPTRQPQIVANHINVKIGIVHWKDILVTSSCCSATSAEIHIDFVQSRSLRFV
ncbi:hypothetical protein GGR33_002683 [Methylobacterium brachythecii]|uniref:Uncharacterized protein n=1 Tax=Methylobacterium brachythecii TaxID=1176177 RepID=A0A7W6AM64_9HYPH|nr:hypothetical protein [Methylobacterium brachythecii]